MNTPDPPLRHPERIEQWNATARDYARDITVVDFLDRAAVQFAELPAVRTTAGVALTHGQLAQESCAFAKRFAEFGVGRGTPVALLVDHLPEAIVAMHAIVRVGGHYIPLDPRWPLRRMVDVLEPLSAHVMVVTQGFERVAFAIRTQLPSVETVIVVDDLPVRTSDCEPIVQAPLELTPGISRPVSEDLAYVIFTSGTTGRPKGVAVQHRSVVNLIDWFNRRHEIGPSDVLLQNAAFSFDLSVYDVFGLLAAGGSLLLLPAERLAEPGVVARALVDHEVTLWNSAPAAFTVVLMFASLLPHSGRSALRRVFLSGDWIPLATFSDLGRAFPDAALVALGGATEACVWSNDFLVDCVDPRWISVPYGHPMQNARYYVLREDLTPCEIDEAGELYIAGDCVVIGYLNEPELTASRFLPDPWQSDTGDRMYRTGDRAKWTSNGWVEFLGRVDSQVKIRGFRVELSEIEYAALQMADIEEAVALTTGDPRDPILGLAARASGGAGVEELLAHLDQILPRYMIPTKVRILASFPVGPNGKIDRNHLRQLLAAGPVKSERKAKS